MLQLGFPCGSAGKESTCNAGDPSLIPGLGRSPGKGNGYPLQYSGLENPYGQKSLAGYSPWSPKELDTTTEQLSLSNITVIPHYTEEETEAGGGVAEVELGDPASYALTRRLSRLLSSLILSLFCHH